MSSIIAPPSTEPASTASPSASPTPTTPITTATPTSTSTTAPTSTAQQASSATSSSASTPPSTAESPSASSGSPGSSATSSVLVTSPQSAAPSGGVSTLFSYITPTPTSTSTPTSTTSSSNSFFSNTGAVAGVFTVVGLIAVALAIALLTNAIRRRRAQKFDRDVAEAAAEAALSSRSPFDDYSYPNNGGNGGGYGYSDNSHGTYQQPPMPSHKDSYGMSEMSQYDPYAAGAAGLAAAAPGRSRSRKESEARTPGIAGVGAGNLAREPSRRTPYHAFAGPGPQVPELQDTTGSMRYRRGPGSQDMLEAAGLVDAGAAAMAANNVNNGGAFINRRPSDYTQNNNGRSQGYGSPNDTYPPQVQPGYQSDPYPPQRQDTHPVDPYAGYISTPYPPSSGLPTPHTAPSPSPPAHQSDHTFGDHEDYHDSSSPTALRGEEQRVSYQDDTDYSQGNRVLRVTNE
ncbi:hypothetical protein BS17DRAFT_877486 [Gyrodon lividus]|nr:hypothetical protein BS17DRAFT_877486 [Gyrodon lividus]